MSIFTNVRNQQVLWSVINQNERITNAFSDDTERQIWFRDIIEYFDINSDPPHNIEELKKLNKNVLQYMAQDIKSRHQKAINPQSIQPTIQPTIDQSVAPQNMNQEQTYEQREREYRQLLDTPTPTNVPNFQEDTTSFNGPVSVADIERLEQIRTQDTNSNPLLQELVELRKKTEETQTDLRREIDSLKTQLQICLEYMKAVMDNNTSIAPPTQPTQPTQPTITTSPETIMIDDIPVVAENKNRDEASIHIEDIPDEECVEEGVEHQFQL